MEVGHLLLDCDGVLQQMGGGTWRGELQQRLGERTDEFVRAVDALEAPALRGEADFPAGLDSMLAAFGLDLDAEALYTALWESITVRPEVRAVAEDATGTGVQVHLATNQHPRRASLMRRTLGYQRFTGQAFYSCDLGVAKPEPAFFAEVLAQLGDPRPDTVAFVDDSGPNVDAAAGLGIRAVQWHHDEGEAALRDRLARAGLTLGRRP